MLVTTALVTFTPSLTSAFFVEVGSRRSLIVPSCLTVGHAPEPPSLFVSLGVPVSVPPPSGVDESLFVPLSAAAGGVVVVS